MILPGHKALKAENIGTYCICDDDVQTAQSIYSLLYNPLTICMLSHVLHMSSDLYQMYESQDVEIIIRLGSG